MGKKLVIRGVDYSGSNLFNNDGIPSIELSISSNTSTNIAWFSMTLGNISCYHALIYGAKVYAMAGTTISLYKCKNDGSIPILIQTFNVAETGWKNYILNSEISMNTNEYLGVKWSNGVYTVHYAPETGGGVDTNVGTFNNRTSNNITFAFQRLYKNV